MPAYQQDLDAGAICSLHIANQNGMTNGFHDTKGANQNGLAAHLPSFEVCHDGLLGRHLVATRDIMAGEVILQEAPVVTGPPLDFRPCCVSCYKPLTQANFQTCSKDCGWPVCSNKCDDSPTHSPECNVTRNVREDKVSIEDWDAPCSLFECLIVLRCLTFRDSNPVVWAQLSKLEAHMAKRRGSPQWERERVSVAQFLTEYFKLEHSEDDILRICGVIQVNGFGVRLTNPAYVAVYNQLSFIEHHCVPNCTKSWNSSGDLTVRAISHVPKGSHLSICYTEPLWGTVSRRGHLVQELLLCRCSRCADPTEFGTYYSALRCSQSSCEGFVLPEEPLADVSVSCITKRAGNSRWQCDRCGLTRSAHQVDIALGKIDTELSCLSKTDAASYETFLENGLQMLHENHFYLTEVRILLAQLIGQGSPGLEGVTDHQLELKITLCRQVLALASTLFPGVVRVTGIMRYELYRALTEAVRREIGQDDSTEKDVSKKLIEAQRLLLEAVSILSFEPEILPEGQIFIQASKQLEKYPEAIYS